MSVNKVILLGHVGKDPEIRSFDNGKKVASFSLATTENYKDKNGERVEKVEWHNINFWSPLAEVIEKYVKKGSKLYIEGKIRTRSYEQEGVKKYTTDIEGKELTMLDSKPKAANETGNSMPEPAADAEENDLPF